MRILRLLPLVALLAVAVPARAQTAADSALVREIVERMNLEHQFELLERISSMLIAEAGVRIAPLRATPADLRKLDARLVRVLLADPRPEHLRAIRDHFASGTTERTMALTRELTEPSRLMALVTNPDAARLGDRELALRLYRANRSIETERRTQEAMVEYLEKSSAVHARLAAAGVPPDAFFTTLRRSIVVAGADPSDAEVLGARALLGRMDPADVEASIAFGESDAARYLNETTSAPVVDALSQWMGAWMERFVLAMFDAADEQRRTESRGQPLVELDLAAPSDAPVEISFDPSPVRDPLPDLPPSDAAIPGGVFDVVEREPELIGGLDGLAARLVYPESARRANVEGTVYVTFVVDLDGRPRHISSVGVADDALRSSAMDVVQASRFIPGQQDGRAVRVRYTLPVRFTLR